MKTTNKSFFYLTLLLVVLFAASCANAKTVITEAPAEEEPPVEIPQAEETPDSFTVSTPAQWTQAVRLINLGGSGRNFTINVIDDFSVPGDVASFVNSDITITITGDHIITLRDGETGRLLIVDSGQIVIMEDIVFMGHSSNDGPLVMVKGGELSMQGGSKVTGNTAPVGGGVWVNRNSSFIMRDNSSVSGNAAASQVGGVIVYGSYNLQNNASVTDNFNGGVRVEDTGVFTMWEDAFISGNGGRGVMIYNGVFIMRGGSIYGNTSNEGAGVFNSGGTFRLVNGIVYGYNASPASMRNNATSSGSAMTVTMNGRSTYGGPEGVLRSFGTGLYYHINNTITHNGIQ